MQQVLTEVWLISRFGHFQPAAIYIFDNINLVTLIYENLSLNLNVNLVFSHFIN